MSPIIILSLGLLVLAGVLSLARILRDGSVTDRVVGLDTLLLVIVCGLGVQAAASRSDTYLDVMLVTTLLGFLGTVAIARYVEQRGPR